MVTLIDNGNKTPHLKVTKAVTLSKAKPVDCYVNHFKNCLLLAATYSSLVRGPEL